MPGLPFLKGGLFQIREASAVVTGNLNVTYFY